MGTMVCSLFWEMQDLYQQPHYQSLNPSLNLKAIMPNRSHRDSRPYDEYEHLF